MDIEAVAVYSGSLSELNSLSKPQIFALTMMAEDNIEYAVQIAACIESHLKSMPNEQKLPVLYLIDSICKNYPNSSYVELFTQNIVSNFCSVFEVSKEQTRRLLYKLRITWGKAKTFPPNKLNAIDQRVHEKDPNWPILEDPKTKDNTVPNLISKTQTQQQPQQPQQHIKNQNQQQSVGSTNLPITNNAATRNVRNKQPKTRGSKKSRNANNNANNLPSGLGQNLGPAVTVATNGLPIQLHAQPAIHVPVPPTMLQPDQHTISQFYTHIIPPQTQQVAATLSAFQHPPSPNPFPTITPFGYPTPEGIYSDRGPMMQTQYPMPQQPTPPISQPSIPQQQTNPPNLFSDLDMVTLNSLYGGKQCSSCSLRFDDTDKHQIHLDWHYRQNSKSDNAFARRKWYYPLNLWVQFR